MLAMAHSVLTKLHAKEFPPDSEHRKLLKAEQNHGAAL
jgi:hypothetical protein